MTTDDKVSAINTFKKMLCFRDKYSKDEIEAIDAGIKVLSYFVCEDAISRRAMIMATCANCAERICPFRDVGTDPSTACNYVQRIKNLKPVLPLNSEKDKSVEEDIPQKYRLAENLNVVLMLERDRGVQSDEIVMRMITTDEKGKKTRQDVMLSEEEAKALRKGLKQQIMRSKEKKREEGDD